MSGLKAFEETRGFITMLGSGLAAQESVQFLGKVVATFESRNRRFQIFRLSHLDETVHVSLNIEPRFNLALGWALQLWDPKTDPEPHGFEDILEQWVTVTAHVVPRKSDPVQTVIVYTWARASEPSYLSNRSILF